MNFFFQLLGSSHFLLYIGMEIYLLYIKMDIWKYRDLNSKSLDFSIMFFVILIM